MKYTVEFPLTAVSTADDVEKIARAVDRLGFDALAFTEHPAPSRAWLDSTAGHPTFDMLGSLAYCAAITERVRLMTYLVVLPYHRPFMVAKALSTIDLLSRGRVTAVVGAGYLRAEFDALGVPFEERNALLDEALAVLPEIWSGRPVTRTGSNFTAEEIVSQPVPAQPGGPPLWIGGNGRLARERAARAGGWSPLFITDERAPLIGTAALTGVDALGENIREVRDRAKVLRGDDAEVVVQALTPQSRVMFGEHSVAEHQDFVTSLAEVGVDWFVLRAPGGDAASVVDSLEYYAAELMI
ncbi:TIGR03619 family F420-dependent LLM class oxidoreductase [Agromyces sp. Marseille-P2726]|uniref:TIGR03619 family F420-dependent LLM class oxidoreductase n=1 Tax=Agromyces sp. Marseille-P2726 TaxID=2709132 RepID=UPI00156DEC89|nr:TIGR03619 family F420-dependent LLM class oxidoreductase [Agromyces sp. Marseille-P2726]